MRRGEAEEELWGCSSSNTTPTSATVTIGASKDENGKYVQVQHEANSKEHLAGPNYPMWGSTSTEANTIPMMNVQHLSAIVALKIYNNGDGQDIKVTSAGLGVPEYKEYDDNNILIKTHPEEIIVGAFNKLNLTSSDFTLTPVNKSSSNFARLELDTPITIPYGAYKTVYFAVKPFVAENRFVTVQVNGSDKPAKINANFVAGKITTIKVNINGLSLHDEDVNPQTSNILDMTSTGIKTTWGGASWEAVEDAQTLTYQPYSDPNLIINGNTPVSALVIGSESEPGIIKITGTAAELLPKVPVEFYVTSYNNKKAAMRVENIMAGFNFKLWIFPINMTLAFSYEALTTTDDGSTPIIADTTKLNFNGIVPVEQVDEYITILGEEPIHKKVASEQIENLLQKFDDNTTDGANPTFDGLKKAITSPDLIDTDNAAKTTADILYNKIRSKLVNKVGDDISDWLFGSNSKAFFQKVKDLPIEVTLTTLDPDGPEGDVYDPRITVWGINSPELVQNGN